MVNISILVAIFIYLVVCLAVPNAAPVNLTVQNISANSLSVSWERPSEIDVNGVLRRYEVDYFIEGDSNTQTVNVIGINTTLEGLNNYTIYNVSVYAFTIGRGPPASEVERTSENGMYLINSSHH